MIKVIDHSLLMHNIGNLEKYLYTGLGVVSFFATTNISKLFSWQIAKQIPRKSHHESCFCEIFKENLK